MDIPSMLAAPQPRSLSPTVRNPLLAMPSAARASEMPPEAREWLLMFLSDIRRDAQQRAEKCWRTRKPPLAAYWKLVAVLAGHTRKVLLHTARPESSLPVAASRPNGARS